MNKKYIEKIESAIKSINTNSFSDNIISDVPDSYLVGCNCCRQVAWLKKDIKHKRGCDIKNMLDVLDRALELEKKL